MSERINILIVDDEQINLKLLRGILKGFQLNILSAMSGEEALKIAARGDFALILLDVMMPGMDGFECAERLREKPETRSTPIIFVTAINKEQRHIFRGYELGAVDYLFKPVEPEVLRGKVRTFVELHRQRRSIETAATRLSTLVHKLEESRNALEESERRYRIVADYNYDWESWISPDDRTLYVSPACERISGYPPERFINDPGFMETIMHQDDIPLWRDFLSDEEHGDGGSIDFRIYNSNARMRWVNAVKRSVVDQDEHLGSRVSLRDVTERREMKERMEHQALHDPMTGLPNRVLCMERVNRARQRAKRHSMYFAVLLLDLDRFKVINETLGHVAGDKLLAEVADRLRGCVRDMDTVGRFGGDEFVLLVEEFHDHAHVKTVADKIISELQKPFMLGMDEVRSSASMGVVVSDGKCEDCSEDILHNAHIAMYAAKDAGKNQYTFFEDSMREKAVRTLTLEKDLRRALRDDEFILHYQPIINLESAEVTGFETLIRWEHPDRGLVSPGEFIPIAEDSGLIVEMGEWVLRKAAGVFTEWLKQCRSPEQVFFSVNISARQFREPSLVQMVDSVLAETGLPPKHLKLEITETVIMLDVMDSVRKLNALKDIGISLSVDDFGTGYSSMSYLQKFPVDQLKVDLSFVQRLDRDRDSVEIVRAIINLAHALKLSVVAEGIETQEQKNTLYSLHCDHGQGYLFSKPVPESDAREILLTPNALKL